MRRHFGDQGDRAWRQLVEHHLGLRMADYIVFAGEREEVVHL